MKLNASRRLCKTVANAEIVWVPRFCVVILCHTYSACVYRCSWSRGNMRRSFQPGNDLKSCWKERWDWYLTQRLTLSIQECLILQVDWDTQWSRMSTADREDLPKVVMVKSGVCVLNTEHMRMKSRQTFVEKNISQALRILIQLRDSIIITLWFLCASLYVYVLYML